MNIWNFVKDRLKEEKSVYFLINIEIHGSSPGKQGFSMAVSSDGKLFGSIGGGTMEFKLVEECRRMLSTGKQKIFIKRQVHKGDVEEGSGMICSGEQTVAFVPLVPPDIQTVERITSCLNKNKTGILSLSGDSFKFELSNDYPLLQYQCTISNKNNWAYKELIGFKNTIYIIGAGHVGFAVSKLFSQLGFNVVIFDNRSNLSILTNNAYADVKKVIDYNKIGEYLPNGTNLYIVIMTNNHTYDKKVLSLVIRKKVKYIGLMGSVEKIADIKKLMKTDGFSESELSQLHAPIGISISSQTPDEIAISIAAEIIKVKNS
jgi:xanthine dehydrogenase accessory factor